MELTIFVENFLIYLLFRKMFQMKKKKNGKAKNILGINKKSTKRTYYRIKKSMYLITDFATPHHYFNNCKYIS